MSVATWLNRVAPFTEKVSSDPALRHVNKVLSAATSRTVIKELEIQMQANLEHSFKLFDIHIIDIRLPLSAIPLARASLHWLALI
jgi:hypothetical protein